MTRPGFALSVLLVAITGSLLAVRASNGQQLDYRVGGAKFGLCPLIGTELYDGGFGAHICEVSPARQVSESPAQSSITQSLQHTRADKLPKLFLSALPSCSVNEWSRERAAPVAVPVARHLVERTVTKFLSEYDPVYDQAVYGVSAQQNNHTSTVATCVPSQDFAGWDWCEGECGGCLTAQSQAAKVVKAVPAPAVTSVARQPMEVEPRGIEEYYAMYGGRRYELPCCDDNYGYQPAGVQIVSFAARVRAWSQRWTVALSWENIGIEIESLRDQWIHRLLVSRYWPICAQIARDWQERSAVTAVRSLAGAEQACGRAAVLTLAKSLHQASLVLQNASRRLAQMVENPPVTVSTSVAVPDQR